MKHPVEMEIPRMVRYCRCHPNESFCRRGVGDYVSLGDYEKQGPLGSPEAIRST